MEKLFRPVVCQDCAQVQAHWNENCPHAMELSKNAYNRGLQDCARPRLTSADVRRALNDLSPSWKNFYHLAADALNRILDEKEKTQ